MKDPRREVRTAFAKAAERYDGVAHFQRQAGEHLLAGLDGIAMPDIVLDAGCGTGHGAGLLRVRYPDSIIVGLDFALPMVQRFAHGKAICADAEQIPLADASVDLFWSSLALQWCDPRKVFAEARRILAPGGRLAVATLGPGTFAELRHAFAAVDAYAHTIPFRDGAALQAQLSTVGFNCIRFEKAVLTRYYPDFPTLFAAIRDLGANRVTAAGRRNGLMGKVAWQRFQAAYEDHRSDAGLPLSYETYFIHASP